MDLSLGPKGRDFDENLDDWDGCIDIALKNTDKVIKVGYGMKKRQTKNV
jgi:hypothetical protein